MGRTLYVSQQDCYLSLDQERLAVINRQVQTYKQFV